MIGHVLDTAREAECARKVMVVGHGAEAVQGYVGDGAEFVLQEQQLGTGHAVRQVEALLGGEEGTTVILYGDTPLVTSGTIRALQEHHTRTGSAATVLTAVVPNPQGLGSRHGVHLPQDSWR